MKIDKVIFSCSEEYSDFWSINSKIFSEQLNIEPVCLLFSENDNFKICEKYGQVKRMKFVPNLPKIIQITWAKFYHTKIEPATTWIIGDIDQIPLQRDYFVNTIEKISDCDYVHLNYDGCGQTLDMDPSLWLVKDGERGGGFDLPAHYHVAKGKTFHNVLGLDQPFEQQIQLLTSGKYGLGAIYNNIERNSERYYWIAEEQFSSHCIREQFLNEKINFHGFSYENRNNTQRINRSAWTGKYHYDKEKLVSKKFVDIHCHRPFSEQENFLYQILERAFQDEGS
tara:strand:- start:3675 stop:4520 length:846 start_codon:yes stop_codon:yes gene_type:complete